MIKTISIQEIYRHCCYHNRPLVFLRALRIYGHNSQLKANSLFVETNTIISNKCSGCDKLIENNGFDYYAAYWTPMLWRPVHKNCKVKTKEFEIISCQTIDADCNDCKHFIRGNELCKGVYGGTCLKYNKPTKANINFCTGHECFEHRKQLTIA